MRLVALLSVRKLPGDSQSEDGRRRLAGLSRKCRVTYINEASPCGYPYVHMTRNVQSQDKTE